VGRCTRFAVGGNDPRQADTSWYVARRTVSGEAAAAQRFEALFEANYARVLAYALRRVDRQVAEDVAAETFAVAWRRLAAVPADELPWLYGVARRTIANQRRGNRRRAALLARLSREAPAALGSADVAGAIAERAAVVAALERLSERDRETLRLIAWEGLDTARAARAAGCSSGAFAVRLHRARRRLVKELAAAGHIPTEVPTA
jgi:RNA polymerase sigma-70 factor (ECF subfamily)